MPVSPKLCGQKPRSDIAPHRSTVQEDGDPGGQQNPTSDDVTPLPGLGLDLGEPPLEVPGLKHVQGQGGDVLQHHAVLAEALAPGGVRVRVVGGRLVRGAAVGTPRVLLGHGVRREGSDGRSTHSCQYAPNYETFQAAEWLDLHA